MTYRRANTNAQWFADRYPGARITPNVAVLHTTEGTDWPGYEGGKTAPNTTGKPDCRRNALDWRAHFPDTMSSRALRNLTGGVETNTLNAYQVELVGTCDPGTRDTWQNRGMRQDRDFIFWPEAPEWALRDVADLLADLHDRYGLQLRAPAVWLPYPASYGMSRARMSFPEWRAFRGVCGHQHVPENAHGDPGDLPIDTILGYARGEGDDMPLTDADLTKIRAVVREELATIVDPDDVPKPDNDPMGNPKNTHVKRTAAQTRLWRLVKEVLVEVRALNDREGDPGK